MDVRLRITFLCSLSPQALQETQKAAIRFERANSQHAAAKEMVYLAEEGLRTEGRCFDHAWQVRRQFFFVKFSQPLREIFMFLGNVEPRDFKSKRIGARESSLRGRTQTDNGSLSQG